MVKETQVTRTPCFICRSKGITAYHTQNDCPNKENHKPN